MRIESEGVDLDRHCTVEVEGHWGGERLCGIRPVWWPGDGRAFCPTHALDHADALFLRAVEVEREGDWDGGAWRRELAQEIRRAAQDAQGRAGAP
jgi:hypothetical protein